MAKSEDVIILDDSDEDEPMKVQSSSSSPENQNQSQLRKRKSTGVISVDTSDDDDEPLINHRRSLQSAKTTPVKQPVTNSDFEFKRPPDCPVFYPTKEQFENSLDYINSLSEYGEKYGIIRIVPPKGWAPRFSIEEKKFRFIPRLQNLKKVDLKNRTKHEFFEKVKRFWEERDGKPFHVPVVEGRKLNIYQMHRVIAANGGFAKVNVDKLWPEIALTMGYRSHWAPYIKRHFKSILLPMEHLISTHRKETKRPMRACVSESSNTDEIATFGFEMSNNCYSLSQFEAVADKFKSNYFKTSQPKDIPLEDVERNYWRIVTSNNDEENAEDVEVEYGADLNATGSGSGFPSNGCNFVLSNDQKYIDSSWNLNNIPLMENSVLSLINADISGMKSPWLYVGMLFSTFCWHTEDHWTSSINYLHIGEPKTWYGVPRTRAADFEKVMKSMSPELFDAQPDLLHQLVTTMNPQILMEHGIPVYRTDQRAGEFIVTFPRAYHAGFNQGFNFAEAVNFALPAWVKVGRECIEHYASVGRGCVFSHDELVCRIAIHSDRISTELARMCMDDLEIVIERELQLRKKVKQMGIEESERELFEVIPDDDRQCMKCQTTCFLSALVTISVDENDKPPSSPDNNKIYCLKHYEDTDILRLPPSEYMLKYRYTVDELGAMIKKLRTRILKSEAPSATNTNNTSCKLESKHDFKQKIMLKDEC